VVNWSQRARADLKAVHDYIAKDSPQNAKVVAREIRRRADGIEAAPRWPQSPRAQ
jgi:toxin ParE1/3/4